MKLIKTIIVVVVCALGVSCSTTQKFFVTGAPDTKIFTPGRVILGTINSSGVVEVELQSDAYCAYLLAQGPDSELMVPFALDFKEQSYAGSAITEWCGYTVFGGGAVVELAGLVALLAGDEELGAIMVSSGLGAMAVGCPMIGVGRSRQEQLDHVYNFKYLPTQATNNSFQFQRPNIEYVQSVPLQTDVALEVAPEVKVEKDEVKEQNYSTSTKSFGSKSTKTFKDLGVNLAGVYVGNGVLKLNGKTIETYKDIKVELHRIDQRHVAVQVIEANGVEFFGEASSYTVKRNSDKSYSLMHEKVSEATIEIDVISNMLYLHPRVNIDGDMYTLEIKASKK